MCIALFPVWRTTQVTRYFLRRNYIPQRKILFHKPSIELNIAFFLPKVVSNTTSHLCIEVSVWKEYHEVQQAQLQGPGHELEQPPITIQTEGRRD